MKKALLVVSFGTSLPETRERTIYAIENALSAAFPDRTFYRAWTSGMICRKILKTEGLAIDSVAGALERMLADGVEDLLVQPTHLLDGEENRLMTEAITAVKDRFRNIVIGAPLLASDGDLAAMAKIMAETCPLDEGELFVWMGHGSAELKKNVYDALNTLLRRTGDNRVVGTVEFDPAFAPVLDAVREQKPKKIFLAPLMVVAGDHAVNDMAGDEPDSWKNRLAGEGCEVECILKGLGEYPPVREMYIAHAKAAKAL